MSKVTAANVFDTRIQCRTAPPFRGENSHLFDQDLGELVISCQLVMAHPYVSDTSKHVTVEKRRITVCTAEYELGNSVDQKL